jgi:hypothetical protein
MFSSAKQSLEEVVVWHAIVYWNTQEQNSVGWSWRVQNLENALMASGSADSVENGMERIREYLENHEISPTDVEIEVEDVGVWDKC